MGEVHLKTKQYADKVLKGRNINPLKIQPFKNPDESNADHYDFPQFDLLLF